MATLLSEDYESNTDGQQLSSSNTDWTTLTASAAFTAQTEQYKSGSVSGYFTTSAANKSAVFDSGNTDSTWYIRFYIRPVTLPGAAVSICNATPTGDTVPCAQIRMTSGGALQLRDKYTDVGSALTIGGTNAWTRVDWKVTPNASTGSQEMRVFYGADLENDINNWTYTTTSVNCRNYGTSVGRIAFGVTGTETMAFYCDDNAVSNSDWLGSSATITEKTSSDSGAFSLGTESGGTPLVIVNPTDSGILGLSTESRSFATVEMTRSDSGIYTVSESASAVPDTAESLGVWYMSIKPRVGVW